MLATEPTSDLSLLLYTLAVTAAVVGIWLHID
jgi:hypothetical protein